MKVSVNGVDLGEAVSRVIKATSTRNLNPILEGIKLHAQADRLVLTGSDLELSIEKSIKADVIRDGEAVVPGKFLFEYIKRMDSAPIDLDLGDNRKLTIRYQDSSSTIKCQNEDEYPPVKVLDNAETFTVAQKDLRDLINKIIFCVATDDTRPTLKGCLIETVGDTITGVALDGFRLAKCSKTLVSSTADMSMILPTRSLTEINKLLDDSDEPVIVRRQRNFMSIELGDTRITTRLLDGDFINYSQLLSTKFESEVILNKKQFEEGLDRASLLSRIEKNNLVKLNITENLVYITSESELGRVEEKLVIRNNGKDIYIAFNVRYLLDSLKAISDEFVKLKLFRPESPCILTSTADTGDYLYLILPIRITK